jgi:adenylate cyclase
VPEAVPSLKPWGPWRRAAYGALLGLVLAGGLLLLRGTTAMETLELRLVDVRTRAFVGDRPADPRIVLALIDERSHERITHGNVAAGERWPWPLKLHGYVMKALAAAKVRAVVVDIYHLERGTSIEDLTLTEEEKKMGWLATLVSEAKQGDDLAADYQAVERVALAFQLEQQPTPNEQPARVEVAQTHLLPPGVPFLARRGLRGDHAQWPLSRPARGAALLGFANVESSADGVFRGVSPSGRWRGKPVVSLALAGALLAVDGVCEVRGDSVRLGEAEQPLDAQGGFFLNFRGEPGRAYRRVDVADLFRWGVDVEDGVAPAEFAAADRAAFDSLRDAVVMYGVNLAGSEDIVTTPLAGNQLGPEVQATFLDNLLHGDGRVRVARTTDAAILVVLCLLAGALGSTLRGRLLPHLPAVVFAAVLVGAAWLLFRQGRVIDLVTPALGLLLAWGSASVLRLATEGRRNKWLEGTFGRYVSTEVVEALKKDPTLLALGGRRRELTILFSDVAGFTRISENLPAEQVVRLLNRYLTTQSKEVMGTGGVIDKFEGDAVMAFWGDPLETEDHALSAVKAALKCLAVLPTLDPLLRELGLDGFDIRIGLNSGPALVGNMGSEERFDYTCMGDNVNLASRLEGANKVFASRLLIGPVTYLLVKDHVVTKRLADLVVVGRSTPVRVYEVLSLREDADEDTKAHVAAFGKAHEGLRKGDLAAAWEALAEAEARRPGDGPTAWLRILAGRMRKGEAPTPWDGTWRLTEK